MEFVTLYGIKYPRRKISVYFDNGDRIDTTFNGSVDEIVTNYFNVPIYLHDSNGMKTVRARSIVFHNEPNRKILPNSERRERLVKIWNLTDETMKKEGYTFRTRVSCEVTPDNFRPVTWRESYAYFPSDKYERFE